MLTPNRWLSRGSLCLLAAALLAAGAPRARAEQSIAVLVNDEPITTYDVAQRQKFLGLTGSGERMRAKLADKDSLNKQFREFAMSRNPKSQEEVMALQKEFFQRLQQQAMSEAGGSKKQEAVEQLIDERLQIQAAKKLSIVVTDDEVNQTLTQMAKSGQKQLSLDEFLKQFSSQGVNPNTLRERIRAQIAWRDVIRRVYGARVASAAPDPIGGPETASSSESAELDLRILHLSVPQPADQKIIAQRFSEAESIRKRFSSCEGLANLAKPLADATVRSAPKSKISAYPASTRALLVKASAGQMTPPVVGKDGVEAYAVCSKKVSAASPKEPKADKRQEEFAIYARRHLKDVKQNARIDYPKGG
jgi:peptidyl-prolyl cis-trans isomerase SurA